MVTSNEIPDFELRAHMGKLWRRRKWVAAIVLAVVASAVVASLMQTPLYRGEVKLLLRQPDSGVVFAGDSTQEPSRRVKDEMEVIKSQPVRAVVQQRFGPGAKASVSEIGDTDVVEVAARSTDARHAGEIARAFALAYIEYRQRQGRADLDKASVTLKAQIAALDTELDSLDKQIVDALNKQTAAAIAQARATDQRSLDLSQLPSSEPAAGLTARRSQLLAQQGALKQRQQELAVAAELRTGDAELITSGPVPTTKVRPRPVRAALLGTGLGLFLGLALAFMLEFVDDSVKTKEDLDRAVPVVPVLGLIPLIKDERSEAASAVVALSHPSSPSVEAYRSLRTSLRFLGVERAPRVFQFTSPNASDGKSSIVSNLGVVLARSGQRVVMVDCDLRRSRLHHFFGLPNEVGFTSALIDDQVLEAALQPVAGIDNLMVLTAGPMPPNPSELLSAKGTAELIASLQSSFEVVLIDCPPVLPVSDAMALSTWVDATVMVVSAGTTTRKDVRRALEVLQQVDAPLVGTVLNRVDAHDSYGYPYLLENGRRSKRRVQLGLPPAQHSPTGRTERPNRGGGVGA